MLTTCSSSSLNQATRFGQTKSRNLDNSRVNLSRFVGKSREQRLSNSLRKACLLEIECDRSAAVKGSLRCLTSSDADILVWIEWMRWLERCVIFAQGPVYSDLPVSLGALNCLCVLRRRVQDRPVYLFVTVLHFGGVPGTVRNHLLQY